MNVSLLSVIFYSANITYDICTHKSSIYFNLSSISNAQKAWLSILNMQQFSNYQGQLQTQTFYWAKKFSSLWPFRRQAANFKIWNIYTHRRLALDEPILDQRGSYTEEWQPFMWHYE